MAQPLLMGEQHYVEPTPDPRVSQLEREKRELLMKVSRMEVDLTHAREEAARAVGELRRVLSPLYRSLQHVFGEMDSIGSVETPSGSAPQFDPKWEAWKQKLGAGTAPARVIDALLTHGPLNRNQLRQSSQMGWSTLDAATSRLKNLSLIEKNGDRWNLKTT